MSAILIVPAWCRQGAAIDYLASDGEWHPAVIAYLTEDAVVIELSDSTHWDMAPEAFAAGQVVRRSQAVNRVMVAAFPMKNVSKVGLA